MPDRRMTTRQPRMDYPYGLPVPPLGTILGGYPPVTPPFNPNAGTGLPSWPPEAAPTQPEAAPPAQPQGNRFLRGMRDPRMTMFLMAVANSLSQPRQWGQTGYGHVGTALTAGYNQLALAQAAQAQQQAAMREEARRDYQLQMEAAKTTSAIKATDARVGLEKREQEFREEEAGWARNYKEADFLKEVQRLDQIAMNERRNYDLEVKKYNQRVQEAADEKELAQARVKIEQRRTAVDEANGKAYRARLFAEAEKDKAAAKATTTGGAKGNLTDAQYGSLFLRAYEAVKKERFPFGGEQDEMTKAQPELEAEAHRRVAAIANQGAVQQQTGGKPGASGTGRVVKRSQAVAAAKANNRDPEQFITELKSQGVSVEDDLSSQNNTGAPDLMRMFLLMGPAALANRGK